LEITGNAAALRAATAAAKKEYTAAVRDFRRQVKDLAKLQAERDQQVAEVGGEFDREIEHIHEAAAELLRICSDSDEAGKYFTVVEQPEVVDNEFNLNLPRYVNTFTAEPPILLLEAVSELRAASEMSEESLATLFKRLEEADQPQ
jgi:type I restriction enzyme M protein